MPGWNGVIDANAVTEHSVINEGNLPGEVYITAENFAEPSGTLFGENAEGGGVEVGPKDFADVMHIKVSADLNGDSDFDDEGEVIYDNSLRDLHTVLFSIDPDERINCKFEAYMPTDLNDNDNTYEDTIGGIPATDGNEDDNAYQADGVMCDIVFHGTTEITI